MIVPLLLLGPVAILLLAILTAVVRHIWSWRTASRQQHSQVQRKTHLFPS